MNEAPRCPACGMLLPSGRLAGLCPACTWGGLLAAEPEEPAAPPNVDGKPLMRLPGYEVQSEIARGGMGIVYRARQLDPGRTVALKMLLPQQLDSPEMAERFRLEVRTLTELEHPAILPVYHVGEHDRLPFFTMKLATGGTLAQRKAQFAGNWRGIADLMAKLADAVHFAHERGVLHRDLKPGNILFDDRDCAYVSDFGLAKFVSADSDLTRSVDFLGTPHYVSPEVASRSARQATTSSDVYSLGAVFYELLTDHPPFEAEGIPALLKKIAEEEPVKPSAAASTNSAASSGNDNRLPLPRDLEVICLKCLSKEPERRYATAHDLAVDLRAWLEGKPIAARPVSQVERSWKWVRRNPILSLMTGALALSLVGAALILWKSYHDVRIALRATRQAEGRAEQNLRDALFAQAQALGVSHGTGQRWQALDALGRAARIQPSVALRNEAAAALARPDLREIARFPAAIRDMGSSVAFTRDLESYVCAEPSGGFALRATRDQRVLASFPGAEGKPARWFVLSPDDRFVAALQDDYGLEIWPLEAKQPLVRWPGTLRQPPAAGFHPDGNSLAAYVPGEALFTAGLDGAARALFPPTDARTIFMRFSPGGDRLAVVREPGGIEVWRCDTPPKLLWKQTLVRAVPWLSWSPDGRRLAAAADDNRGIRVFSADTGQTEFLYSRHLLYPRQFEFSPNGRTIASVGQDWTLRLWDARTGQDLASGVGRHRVMRFSRDGSRLTTAPTDHELAVLELAPDTVFREFRSLPSEVVPNGLSRSPDGKLLLTSHPEVRLYDTASGVQLGTVTSPALAGTARHAFFETNGSAVFYSSLDRGIYRREFELHKNDLSPDISVTWKEEQPIAAHPGAIIWETLESGQTWVSHGDRGLELWPGRVPQKARHVLVGGLLPTVTVSQDARWAAASEPGRDAIRIWDTLTGKVVRELAARSPDRVWFSPDSRWLLASVENGYRTWSTANWQPGSAWEARLDSGDPGEVTFTDNGRLIAARHERETFRLLTFPEAQELVTLKPPLAVPVRTACVSGDGTKLWLLASGYRIFEWNLAELRSQLARLGLDWSEPGPP